jgi:hypothetical protein
MTVLEGRVKITCNGETVELKAGDPAFFIPRRAVHSIEGFKGERLVAQERPDPPGLYKAMSVQPLLVPFRRCIDGLGTNADNYWLLPQVLQRSSLRW